MTRDLSILCVTVAADWARPFLEKHRDLAQGLSAEIVIAAHGDAAADRIRAWRLPLAATVRGSVPMLESVLDDALTHCHRRYVLRLDDDERCSPAMVRWLAMNEYAAADHWKFPRVHLWPDTETALMTAQLFPDHQTRLSVRSKAGGRRSLHAPSPHGGGSLAPVAIQHHKFLVRSREERRRTAQRYDSIQPGYGTGGMLAFSLPEDVYPVAKVAEVGDGRVPWTPQWEGVMALGAHPS